MKKSEIIEELLSNYNDFREYVISLNKNEYNYSYKKRWTAAQQLEHIFLCFKPVVQVFGMSKIVILQNFGKTKRSNKTYEEITESYLEKLKNDVKLIEEFNPVGITLVLSKTEMIKLLDALVNDFCTLIKAFEEVELETLTIPHPLLGKITLKEMLYLSIYDIQQHRLQTVMNLEKKLIKTNKLNM